MGSEKVKTIKQPARWILVLVFLVIVPTTYGVYNIFQPVNYPLRFFRGEVIEVSDTLLLGPYPTEKEMKYLKRLGVTEVISLLDSSMPFESQLIENGRRMAEKYNLTFKNIPLTYLPNLESKENLSRVDELVVYLRNGSNGKYVHCYLGRHRTSLVKRHYLETLSQPKSSEKS